MMTRPFVDRPITDRAAADAAAIEAARRWGLDEPTLLRVGMNAIYLTADAAGELVLRVSAPSAPAESAVELADVPRRSGSPGRTAPPSDAVVVRRAVGHLLGADRSGGGRPDRLAARWERWSGRCTSSIRIDCPRAYPLGSPVAFAWWDFDALLGEVADDIDDRARAGLVEADRAARTVGASSTDVVVCHGDVHPGNVMMTHDGPALIDWDLLCLAPAGWDHGPMMTWHERWGGAAG